VAAMALITTESASIVIGCAIKVHRALGAGLFESVYEPCMAHEMTRAGLHFERQVTVPLTYGGLVFDRGFRADFVVEKELVVELKSVERLAPVHHTQLLTYMRLTGLRKGLLFNFNEALLKHGIKSIVR
jgi:GxxExxY protein